jgi:hypothetical protein
MKISQPAKILIGFLTAWMVVLPFMFVLVWFFFIFSMATVSDQPQPAAGAIPVVFFLVFFFLAISSLVYFGLEIFYIIHILLNRTGTDVARILLGIGIIFFGFVGMPIYYFIYILPKSPPHWALVTQPIQASIEK